MKAFTLVSTLIFVGSANAQFPGLWNGGLFNPWNNPAHPANSAGGWASRNVFAWPASAFIRNGAIRAPIANSPALDVADEGHRALIEHLSERKQAVDSRIHDAATRGATFRPAFVNELLKERMEIVRDIQKVQQEIVRDRLSIVAKRREIAQNLVESDEPISFGLLMASLNRAYGKELADKNIALRRKIIEKFDLPYLRPVVSVFSPESLPEGVQAETKIYQDFEEQKGTLIKGSDIYILTKLTGFSGDKLHLGVDLHGVNKTVTDAQALSEDFLAEELAFQDEYLEKQMNFTETFLNAQLESVVDKQSELQKKIMEKELDKADRIAELVERKQELEFKLAEHQKKIVEQQLRREKNLLEKQAELGGMDFGSNIAENHINEAASIVEKQLEVARQQAEFGQQQRRADIERGLEFLRQRLNFGFSDDQPSTLYRKQLDELSEKQVDLIGHGSDAIEKLNETEQQAAEKQQELIEKHLEKEHELSEKQLEKEKELAEKQLEHVQNMIEKQMEKDVDLAEKTQEKLEKQNEKEHQLLEKQQEKELLLLQKQLDKEQKKLDKQKEKEEKLLEKQKEKEEKELEMQEKEAEKVLERLQRQIEDSQDDSQSEEAVPDFVHRFFPNKRGF